MPNKPDVLSFQDLPKYPPGFLQPPPPADLDLLTAAIKAKDVHKVHQYVTLLIVSGYHTGGPDSNGDYPLILAAKSNDFIITTLVIHYPPNPRNAAGETPLIIAAQLGNLKIVDFLLSKNADATLKDKKQKTALDYALQNQKANPSNKDLAQIVTLLQKAQPKPKAKAPPKAQPGKPKYKP